MALIDDVYSISDARTGDARVHALTLTGWGALNAYRDFTEYGRLYWRVTTGDVFQLYKNEAKGALDLVASGTIGATVDDEATLVQANTSGFSGSVRVVHTSGVEATGDVILTYANENDLKFEMMNVTSLLTSALWEGGARFEEALKVTKATLDAQLTAKLQSRLRRKVSTGEYILADIAKPRQLAQVHSLYTCALLSRWRSSAHAGSLDAANEYEKRAQQRLGPVLMELDYLNSDAVQCRTAMNGGKMERTG